jgi:adenine-specific DNA methylase
MSRNIQEVTRSRQPAPLFTATGITPPPPPKTRYQGSKYKLLDWLWQHLAELDFTTVLDAFGGSACVSHFLKGKGKAVTFNDILVANYLVGRGLVANNSEFLEQEDIAFILNRHDGTDYDDFIQRTFGDIYFTDDENAWLDTVAQNIPHLSTPNKQAIAYYALFQAAISKRPYNLFHRKNLYMRTSDVQRSFGNKTTWDKPFEEHFQGFAREANRAVFKGTHECRAYNMDALEVPGSYDLVYIDTPYINRRGCGVDYHGFYHFLEGLVDYRSWANKVDYGSKHRRLKRVKSPWTDRKRISDAFHSLFERFADSILVVSYRSDGVPSPEELTALMRCFKSNVSLHTLKGNYTYVLSTNRKSTEILVVGTD